MVVSRRVAVLGSSALCASALTAPFILRNRTATLRLAGSVYVGWMPWFLAAEDGTLQEISGKYGLDIQFVRGDYADTIGFFAGGAVDAVVMTNIDAISSIVAAGFSADAILVGSFSNGNDAVLAPRHKEGSLVASTFGLVEFSVSHYLLDRIAELQGLDPRTVKTQNISDSAMIAAFLDQTNEIDGVVTWNPIVQSLIDQYDAKSIADSTSIPREIADMLVVNREVAEANPKFAQALIEVWFDVVGRLVKNPVSMGEKLGQLFGSNGADFLRQLEKTILISDPTAGREAMADANLVLAAQKAKEFALRRGIVDEAPKNWVGFGEQTQNLLQFERAYIEAYGA